MQRWRQGHHAHVEGRRSSGTRSGNRSWLGSQQLQAARIMQMAENGSRPTFWRAIARLQPPRRSLSGWGVISQSEENDQNSCRCGYYHRHNDLPQPGEPRGRVFFRAPGVQFDPGTRTDPESSFNTEFSRLEVPGSNRFSKSAPTLSRSLPYLASNLASTQASVSAAVALGDNAGHAR